MNGELSYGRAIVRPPADTYGNCIRPPGSETAIDLALARRQHEAYVGLLESQGIEIIALDPDPRYPDGCFVEDAAIVTGESAVICEMGASSRRGEAASVSAALSQHMETIRIRPPATIDGGDVVRIGKKYFVGVTERTNRDAIVALERIVAPAGGDVIPVEMTGVLHLKSACSYVGDDTVVICPQHLDVGTFADFRHIVVVPRESYAANCLALGAVVAVSSGFPETLERIGKAGFETVALEMSEFRKGWGSLTCLSVLF